VTTDPEFVITIVINIFVWCQKFVTSEALGPGSVLLKRGKRKPGRRAMSLAWT